MRTMADLPHCDRSLIQRLQQAAQACAAFARLCVGVPSYDRYVAHRRAAHPGEPIPSYSEFFRDRLQARYGRNAQRCC